MTMMIKRRHQSPLLIPSALVLLLTLLPTTTHAASGSCDDICRIDLGSNCQQALRDKDFEGDCCALEQEAGTCYLVTTTSCTVTTKGSNGCSGWDLTGNCMAAVIPGMQWNANGNGDPNFDTTCPTSDYNIPTPTDAPAVVGNGEPMAAADFDLSTETCQENLQYYHVYMDLQLTYPSNAYVACDDFSNVETIHGQLSDTLQTLIGNVFDWDGTVEFGTAVMDASQTLNNVFRRQLLRGPQQEQRSLELRADLMQQVQQCPKGRDAFVGTDVCNADACYWACLVATTTDCGVSSLANWATLGQNVAADLAALNLDCLGDSVAVTLLVDPNGSPDPPAIQTAAPTSTSITPAPTVMTTTETPTAVPTTGATTPAPTTATTTETPTEAPTDTTTTPAPTDTTTVTTPAPTVPVPVGGGGGDDTATDGPTKELPIHAELVFTFFENLPQPPSTAEISTMIDETIQFFTLQFTDPKNGFDDVFQSLRITEPTPHYDLSNADRFRLEFLLHVTVDETSPKTAQDAAKVMGSSNFRDFIHDYIRESETEFEDTFKILFRAKTHVAN